MTFRVHTDWTTPGFELKPVASQTGPFSGADLLQIWWETCAPPDAKLMLVESDTAMLPIAMTDAGIGFVGHEDVVDYRSPLGTGVTELVAAYVESLEAGTAFRFDSLPGEAAEVIAKGLDRAGVATDLVEHQSAAVLDLADTYENYLAGLSKKERHETRRKVRRFAASLGQPRLERVSGSDAVDVFVELHRTSGGEKGQFMTNEMAQFFAGLHSSAGAVVDLLFGDSDTPAAAAFGFEDAAAYYLFNSAYDPDIGNASPGVVLSALLIERAIDAGRNRFDFLKGEETYKRRLGAVPRPLYELAGVIGGSMTGEAITRANDTRGNGTRGNGTRGNGSGAST